MTPLESARASTDEARCTLTVSVVVDTIAKQHAAEYIRCVNFERACADSELSRLKEKIVGATNALLGCLNFFGWSFNDGGLGLDSLPDPIKKLMAKRQEECRAALSAITAAETQEAHDA